MMSKLVTSFRLWWQGISVREQRLMMFCMGLLVVGIGYWGILEPIQQRSLQAQNKVNSEQQLLNWVKNKADEITQLRAQSGLVTTSEPLNQVISSSASRFKVELIRIQPRDDMFQVWVQPIEFNQLIGWITYLKEQQGVDVEHFDVARTDQDGMVDVKRLQFKRGE
ncbi:type II secretion system protein M [Vibrio genomosp. F10]|uniref:type II secretion system protein M n=1 Tax=Vibrio genomosp. F10 TaxID=723171 RepID=UPI000314696E|nr:type II secretion system protein M [Vibrio genomosp. F10]OEF04520.1 general secretion pathway protein GspM [Vibrio genomosp. F10 str. 9ZB36]